MEVIVEELKQLPIEEQRIEIVERKGLGHPDTICDSIMNEISLKLCDEYLKITGSILHHNIDKALLAAGEVENRFGGGIVKKPMLLVIGDRATYYVGEEKIPIEEIVVNTAKNWFENNLRFVDPEKHVKYQVELKQVTAALADIFEKKEKVMGANDTSAAVGYFPLTRTEKLVIDVEKFLNSKEFKKRFPESGEDVKVMAFRSGNNVDLTIAMAFVDKFIDSENTYFKRKEEIVRELEDFINKNFDFEKVSLTLNALDKKGKGIAGLYLSVLGTSADGADSGQVGRGNRVNGVIPLNRPTCSEAAAGKNPVSHVGKIYNLLTYRIATEIYQQVSGIKEAYVWLLSQIGRKIDDPLVAAAQVILEENVSLNDVQSRIKEIIESELGNITKFCEELIKKKIAVC
jgi:S-adenosylmethionine synthetase